MSGPVLLDGLIDRLRGKIDADTWDLVDDFNRNGEYGLAVEVLCDRLHEADQSLPPDEVDEVREIGNSMGLKRRAFLLLTGQAN